MKNSVLAFSAASVLLTSLILCAFQTDFVAALTATSTSATSTEDGAATAPPDTANSTSLTSTSSTVAEGSLASTTATTITAAPGTDSATSTASNSLATSSMSQAQGTTSLKSKPALKLVRIVGSKYLDFFTDGTTTYSFPGDPLLDANLNRPNAPIPVHGNLTWLSTKGVEAYDTASGDLEPNTYAREANGFFIANVSGSPASATSSTPVAFSLLDPTLDSSAAAPAPKTEALVPPAPAHAAAADRFAASTTSPLPNTAGTASSTPDGSTTASASSTAAAAMASSTPVVVPATSTATSTAASSVASSSFASANDNAASTTATQ